MSVARRRRPVATAAIAAVLVLASCGGDPAAGPPAASSPAPVSTEVPGAADFDPADFPARAAVDNGWFPLVPGTEMTWEGHALDGRDRLARKVVFTVTDLTKVIDGVPTVVIWERDYTDGALEEAELSFFAQDDAGNVWHLGEYPEEYDEGEIVKHPLWLAGMEGALPGVHMPAAPAPGTPSYAQGLGPAVGWDDRGQTFAVDEHTCSDLDCYDGVLVIREFSRDEPGAYQLKYYAPGVGTVRVGWGGPNEEEHEVLVLTGVRLLDAEGLGQARAAALEQDGRGVELSPDLYGRTEPATQV